MATAPVAANRHPRSPRRRRARGGPESDDDPGHRKRRHRDRVDQLPPAEPPGRQHRDDDAHRKRKQVAALANVSELRIAGHGRT